MRYRGGMPRTWMTKQVMAAFAGRILPVDVAAALRSASLHFPNPRPVRDGLIAGTALAHGLTIVTRNVTDFAETGVPLFDPWGPSAETSNGPQ